LDYGFREAPTYEAVGAPMVNDTYKYNHDEGWCVTEWPTDARSNLVATIELKRDVVHARCNAAALLPPL
jgi:hypothetical protein